MNRILLKQGIFAYLTGYVDQQQALKIESTAYKALKDTQVVH